MSYQVFKVGDRVVVSTEYNGNKQVEITEVLDDVSQECDLEPGPGFVGVEEVIPGMFEELVFSDSAFVEFDDRVVKKFDDSVIEIGSNGWV